MCKFVGMCGYYSVWTWSSLVQVTAYYLVGLKHYLNLCLIIHNSVYLQSMLTHPQLSLYVQFLVWLHTFILKMTSFIYWHFIQ